MIDTIIASVKKAGLVHLDKIYDPKAIPASAWKNSFIVLPGNITKNTDLTLGDGNFIRYAIYNEPYYIYCNFQLDTIKRLPEILEIIRKAVSNLLDYVDITGDVVQIDIPDIAMLLTGEELQYRITYIVKSKYKEEAT